MFNKFQKTYADLHPIKLNVAKRTCWQPTDEEKQELIDEKLRLECLIDN